MRTKKLFIILILGLVLLPVTPALAADVAADEIAEQLICQCGCGRVLSTHVCATQEEMLAIIEQQLAQGQSQQEILDYFVTQYGEQVLASPPKRGFNLTAWILPFAAILGGGGIIYIAIKKWVKRGKQPQTSVEAEEEDEEYRRRLEKELEDFTEEGFR